MDTKIIYFSKKGHTQKVAEAIADEIGVEAIDITEPHSLGYCDLLFIGLGIYGGKPDENMLKYLDDLPANQIKGAAVFSVCGTGKDQTELAVNLLKHKKIAVYPTHLILKGQFLFLNHKQPNSRDLNKARRFARAVTDSFQG